MRAGRAVVVDLLGVALAFVVVSDATDRLHHPACLLALASINLLAQAKYSQKEP